MAKPKKTEEEEVGTAISISGPERDVKRIIGALEDAGVPIINKDPELKRHPAPEAPPDLRVAVLLVDCRNWREDEN